MKNIFALSTLKHHLIFLAVSWAFIGIIYYGSAIQAIKPIYVIPETRLDQLITFNPQGIWLYLSFFIFVPTIFLNTQKERLHLLTISTIFCGVIAGMIFTLIPSTINYPVLIEQQNSLSNKLWLYLNQQDTRQNCLPSLHGALTTLGIIFSIQINKPIRSTFIVTWGILILFSVIQIRQHLSIDLGAGISLAIICYSICKISFRKSAK